MTNTQPASTPSKIAQGLFGAGILLAVSVVTIAFVAAVVRPSGRPDAPTTQTKPPGSQTMSADRRVASRSEPTQINGSIRQFKANLAELLQGGWDKKDADGEGVRYTWTSATTSTNWAQFWDDLGNREDGTIDQVMIGVGIPVNDEVRILEALTIAHVVVETASGVAVHGPTFTEWARESMGESEAHSRRFGSVTVRLSSIGAEGGVVLLFGMGDEGSSSRRRAERPSQGTSKSPNIVGTTLIEPWRFLAPETVERAADVLASAAIDFAAKSKPSDLTAWKAEIIVLDKDIQEHRVGGLNFDFQWIRQHLSSTVEVSPEMKPAARAELTSSIQRELNRFDNIGVLTSGRSSVSSSTSTASPPSQAGEPRYERLTESILVADFQVSEGESAKNAAPRLVELGKDLCQIPGAELAKLRVLDSGGKLVGSLDLPLTSFLDFHSSDATDRMMAKRMWERNTVLLLQDAGL